MKWILQVTLCIALLFLLPGDALADVLSQNWWNASRMDLHAVRNQICEILGEPKTPYGTEFQKNTDILSENWKDEGNDALHYGKEQRIRGFQSDGRFAGSIGNGQ